MKWSATSSKDRIFGVRSVEWETLVKIRLVAQCWFQAGGRKTWQCKYRILLELACVIPDKTKICESKNNEELPTDFLTQPFVLVCSDMDGLLIFVSGLPVLTRRFELTRSNQQAGFRETFMDGAVHSSPVSVKEEAKRFNFEMFNPQHNNPG